jgi:hypothetical protein
MTDIYKFLGHPFPGNKIVSMVHPTSMNKGGQVELSPQIDDLCRKLLDQLDQIQAKTGTMHNLNQEENYGYSH